MRLLHAIHDFLPRHQAGSEIYAFELCRELSAAHHVTVLCTEYDLGRRHGHVTWRVHDRIPVVEIVNTWMCRTFEETYRPPLVGRRIEQILRTVQPDVVHVHNLFNLSFDLPAMARARGIPVVATLHDYTLVCPSGGQRIHRAEQYVCHTIDPDRCVRCFRESIFYTLLSSGRVAAIARAPGAAQRLALRLSRGFPAVIAGFGRAARRAQLLPVSRQDIEHRLAAARRVFDDIDLFVAPSQTVASEFEQLGLPASKIRVSDYGFAPIVGTRSAGFSGPRAAPLKGAPYDGTAPLRIGYVGTLVWHKGAHVLIDAVRGLSADAYEVKIYGSPDMWPQYAADLRAQAAGLPVHFMGLFDRARIADIYSGLDVLVVPSLWIENSPLVIHEAFMAGVPVIGARIGGIVDLVQDGRTGLLYEPESAAALRATLQRVLDDASLLADLSNAFPETKTIAADAREWERIYFDLCSGKRHYNCAAH